MPLPKYAARVAARLHIWTAVPAPLRLFLPQAAPQLRSQARLAASAAGSASVCLPLQSATAPPCWGALNRGLLLRPEGSRWGLLGVGRSTTRRRSKKFRAPLGRARRAGEPLKGWWEGLDHRSKIQFLPLCGVAVLRSAKTEGAVRARSPTGAMAQPWGKCPPPLAAKNPHS